MLGKLGSNPAVTLSGNSRYVLKSKLVVYELKASLTNSDLKISLSGILNGERNRIPKDY